MLGVLTYLFYLLSKPNIPVCLLYGGYPLFVLFVGYPFVYFVIVESCSLFYQFSCKFYYGVLTTDKVLIG